MSPRQERIESLGRRLRHHDPTQLWYQVAEIAGEEVYRRHGVSVEPGDVVLDVGANVGVAAVYFAAERGAGVVHSFEPVPPLYELLCANVAELPACIPHPYGLSAAAGSTDITYYPGAGAMSGLYAHPDRDRSLVRTALRNAGIAPADAESRLAGAFAAETLRCELRTLSGFLAESALDRVDLLKVDVERAEADVLAGLADADWPRIRRLVVEGHDEHGRVAKLTAALEARGYVVTTDQDAALRGTDVHLIYGTRR